MLTVLIFGFEIIFLPHMASLSRGAHLHGLDVEDVLPENGQEVLTHAFTLVLQRPTACGNAARNPLQGALQLLLTLCPAGVHGAVLPQLCQVLWRAWKKKKSSSQQSNQFSVLATSQAHSDQPLRGSQMLAEPRVSYLTAPSGSSGQCGQCFPAFGWTCPGIPPWRWTRPAVLVACSLPPRVSRTRPLWSAEPSPDACWGPETTNPWLSQKKSTPRCPRPSRPASILPWQSGKHWGGGWRRGLGGQQLASGTCPELSSSSPQSPLKNGPPRPSSQTSPAVAADEEKKERKKDDWQQENRAHPDHVTYRNEMGRLAVLQLDPQPVKVLVAPPHAVLRQVKLCPRRLQEINERIYGPKDKKTGKYSLNIYSLN